MRGSKLANPLALTFVASIGALLLVTSQEADACHRCRRHRCCETTMPTVAYAVLIPNGSSTDKCKEGGINVYYPPTNSWYWVPRNGITYRVPADPGATEFIWHCEGPKNDSSDLPYGTSYIDFTLPPGERVIYEQYWRWG